MVAMTLGLEHPERLEKLVVASVDHQPGHEEFEHPEDPDIARRLPTQADFAAMRSEYQKVAPDPSHFDEIATKTSTMVRGLGGWSDQELGSIEASTLLIVGDTDFVPLSHAVAMYEAMPHAQLAVLPDTTHVGVTQRTNEMAALLDRFLGD
jgi:pimeloyl-ACP methyl ester carboxylesterase